MSRIAALTFLVVAVSAADISPLAAQASRRSDPIQLIVRPRVGDTLWLQLDQVVEIKGGPMQPERRDGMSTDRGNSGSRVMPSRTPEYGPRRSNVSTRVTRMHLFAHSVVEASDLSVTTVVATTDSLLMWVGSGSDNGEPQSMPLPADGRNTRVRVTTDGSMSVNDPPPGAMTLGTTLASMPGMLPSTPVSVGERWVRDIPIPSLPIGGLRADGTMRATFRLDSVTKAGRIAWISMSGTMQRDGAGRELPVGTRVLSAGTIEGELVVDRLRAWITDARTVIDVRSEVSQGPGNPGSSMLLDIRVTQRVRVR